MSNEYEDICNADPFMKINPILQDVTIDIFKNANIDEVTKEAVKDYFLFDRLCTDNVDKWQWLFRRRINMYYPIYKDQLDIWAERKTYKWYFDNYKDQTTIHDGEGTLNQDVDTKTQRELERLIKDIFNGNVSSTSTSDSEDNSKARSFAFNYPESNYSGGVIPYDLENDPSVEFISTQGDNVGKSTNHTEAESEVETNNTDTNNETENETTKTTQGTKQNTTTDWKETVNRQGDNINKLANELLTDVLKTDFFKQFIDKLKPCFQNIYTVDEWLSDMI